MKNIKVADMTLAFNVNQLSFKEKIEIARHLDNLGVDVIDMPEIKKVTTDTLLIRTISSFVKNSAISVSTGLDFGDVDIALSTIQNAKKARIKINIPVSNVQMEYFCHKKPNKLLEIAKQIIEKCTSSNKEVELFAIDATRLDKAFFKSLVEFSIASGVKTITLCDDEGIMLPFEFASFIKGICEEIPEIQKVNLAVLCKNTNGMAIANALTAISAGVTEIKTVVGTKEFTPTELFSDVVTRCGAKINAKTNLQTHEIHRIISQIKWILGVAKGDKNTDGSFVLGSLNNQETLLDNNDTLETVKNAVKTLGYDLTDEDYNKVYDEFLKVASRKTVGLKELDAIVAGVALQVPPTYVLQSYVINNGNLISSSAQIKLKKGDKIQLGICVGDGPVDASFKALEQIIGTHYELDDFQIQSVTEGREAMGLAIVKLRYNGKLYSGNGISTDIIGSAIRAYINAVNKIVYGEM